MNVIEPKVIENLVRADSISKGEEFIDDDGYYYVVLRMQEFYFNCSTRPTVREISNPIWVFNVNTSCLSIYSGDIMVKPVDLEVIVKGKE